MRRKGEPKYDHDIFAYRFNAILYERGISRAELSRRTGLGQGRLSNYIRGDLYPNVEALITIATVLDVSVDYLLGLDGDVKRLASDIKNIATLQKGAAASQIVKKADEIIYKYSGVGED